MRNKSQRGFTLLELLVTLVIVGILITFVAVSFTTNSFKHEIRIEASQLARKIELLRRVATTHNETWGISISRDSYRFLRFEESEQKWEEVEGALYRNHKLPAKLYLQFEGSLNIPTLIDKIDELQPEMVVVPGGEMTPFVLHCKHEHSAPDQNKHVRILQSDGINEVEVMSMADTVDQSTDVE